MTGNWKKLQNEELKTRWAGHVERIEEKRFAYRVLVGNHEGKKPLKISSRRWKHNIKMDLGDGLGGHGLD